MRTGAWTAACLLLAVLAKTAPADVFPVNNRFDIPIKIDPARKGDIQGLELYVSTDQGKTWSQKGYTTPDHESFPYTADVDGEYWFSVLIVDKNNKREPPHPSSTPADKILKVLVDTLKPEVKLRAERQGDSVSVTWEIHEEHLDSNSFQLEWRPEAGQEKWVAVQVSPGMTGHTSIRASEAIVVRASVKDTAENVGKDEAKVPAATGSVTAMGPGVTTPVAPATSAGADSGGPPAPPVAPIARTVSEAVAGATGQVREVVDPIRRVSTAPPTVKPDLPEPITMPSSTLSTPPSDRGKTESIAVTPPQVMTPSTIGPPVPPTGTAPLAPPTGGMAPPLFHPTAPPAAPPAAAENAGNDLQVINTKRVTMEYEVSKVGPSGVGSVDLYLTRDDGMTWKLAPAEHQAVGGETTPGVMRRTLSVDLGEDGVYGFYLVAKSGAGMSKPPPHSGDVPRMRVKLDTTQPKATMYSPAKDKAHPDCLFIVWDATDENLTANPVSIQWAEKPSGPWESIGPSQMANVVSDNTQVPANVPVTGSYSWQVPANIPARVYLRLTVRDTAGNIATAETKEPILIDLSEPDVAIRGLVGVHPH